MKIISLGRGQGKTTRLLYASEFNNAPILCSSAKQKSFLLDRARELGLYIPEPICASELSYQKIKENRIEDILVDDAEWVLQQILCGMGLHADIKAITVTSNQI